MPIGDPPSKAIPWLTAGVLSEAWREEPRELAARVDAASPAETAKEEVASHEKAQRVTQYPAEMGQLIPPPSRATARRSSRQLYRGSARTEGKQAALSCQDRELVVLEPPGQILQAHSSTAAQQRLLTAGQRGEDSQEYEGWGLGLRIPLLSLKPASLATSAGPAKRMLSWGCCRLQVPPSSCSRRPWAQARGTAPGPRRPRPPRASPPGTGAAGGTSQADAPRDRSKNQFHRRRKQRALAQQKSSRSIRPGRRSQGSPTPPTNGATALCEELLSRYPLHLKCFIPYVVQRVHATSRAVSASPRSSPCFYFLRWDAPKLTAV
ncbi:protein TBATA isoform X2 [Dromaius novaehollandiae]